MTDWRADSVVDELLPEELDWQHWVRAYPWAALSIAAIGGYLLGRSQGQELVDSIANRAAESVSGNLHQLIEPGS